MATRIKYFLLVSVLMVWSYGCDREAERDFPRIRTLDAVDINGEGVTLLGEVLNHKDFNIAECGFVIFHGQPSPQNIVGRVRGELNRKTGMFSARPVTGMVDGGKYYYHGYIESGIITTAGNICSYTSKGSKPVQIVDFNPSAAHVLDTILLMFSDPFGGSSNISVTFDEIPARIIGFENEILRVIAPAELTKKENIISVTNQSEVRIYEKKFELLTPEITSFSPLTAAPGDTLTINGSNFHRQKRFNTVRFNNFSITVASSTSTQLKAVVPLLEGLNCDISVIISGQAASAQNTLSITGTPVLWKQVADFPGGDMYKTGSFVLGYHGYAGYGIGISNDYNIRFWRYDLFSDSWVQIASCPGRIRVEAHGFSIDGRGYIGGGFSHDSPQRFSLREFYEYDPAIDRWLTLKEYPGQLDNNFAGSAQVVNDKAYITFTGQDLYTYTPATKLWKRMPVPPAEALKSSAASFTAGSRIYYVCGNNSQGINTNEVWSFDTSDGTWTRMSDFPGDARRSATGFAINGKGYLSLGEDGSTLFNDQWMYDPDSDTWTSIDQYPGVARSNALCMVISDIAFIGTGYLGPNNLGKDVYRFNAYALK